ncbi:ribosome biogenesis protein, partial [archaeon]|nr:ribosome biogenesis protein [archaeon]
MGSKIMFCEKCRRYTMRSICCNLQTKSPKPAR